MTDPELDKLLADVAGVVLQNGYAVGCGDIVFGEFVEWKPMLNHNQMSLVKAGLREQGYGYDETWWMDDKNFYVCIYDGEKGKHYKGEGADELRAWAMAVAQMKEGTQCE